MKRTLSVSAVLVISIWLAGCSEEHTAIVFLKVNPDLTIFEVSCKTGEGLDAWYAWLKAQVKAGSAA